MTEQSVCSLFDSISASLPQVLKFYNGFKVPHQIKTKANFKSELESKISDLRAILNREESMYTHVIPCEKKKDSVSAREIKLMMMDIKRKLPSFVRKVNRKIQNVVNCIFQAYKVINLIISGTYCCFCKSFR